MVFNRRSCLTSCLAAGATAGSLFSWPGRLAAQLQAQRSGRKLVVLWMSGGPSQMDTFDMKPGHSHGGPFKEIATNVAGLKFSEHLPELSKLANHLCLVRGMQTKEGDHSRGTYLVRTGQRPGNPLRYPALPAALAKELSAGQSNVPAYVSILPNTFINPAAYGAGFLGAGWEPLTVGNAASLETPPTAGNSADTEGTPVNLRVDNLLPPEHLTSPRIERRRQYWELLQQSYGAAARGGPAATHDTVYRRALQLAESAVVDAFDLSREPEQVRRRYGAGPFGQGCLMARRLLESGVAVVEISLSDGPGGLSWDSHTDNFNTVQRLCGQLDQGWSQLMLDLRASGLLDQTTVCWMGEFGRTPQINEMGGRDHFPNAWSSVLAGAGIAGGSIVGQTSPDGMEVTERPVTAPELLATLCQAVGVDPALENWSEDRRPVKLVEAQPVREALS